MIDRILHALGEASALFMSQECRGTEIVMPDRELNIIGEKLRRLINADMHAIEMVNKQPLLGYATTGQLLEELSARIEMHATGGLNYRTVDGESFANREAIDRVHTAARGGKEG